MGCESCTFYYQESDGECGQYTWDMCDKNPVFANLRSFPFKKQMPCYKINFWFSEFANLVDGTEESVEKATALYHQKYTPNSTAQ